MKATISDAGSIPAASIKVKNNRFKEKTKKLEREILTLYYAFKDVEVPWYSKVFLGMVIVYALNPIDIIPDFIPAIGYLDDVIIISAAVYVSYKMIPKKILDRCRIKASENQASGLAISSISSASLRGNS
ncbi:DUF1232 domain-containing protein [candidate division WOR-3 bacterium]|nr:DUF1232 domain-containing protein [candidate division WOR-3 bacterium]